MPPMKNTEQQDNTRKTGRGLKKRKNKSSSKNSVVKSRNFEKLSKKILSMEKPSLVITLKNMKFSVSTDAETYSEDETKHIQWIVDNMSKEIFIDKTYVNFDGNRWKDAFIVEDKWYELVKLIVGSDFGRVKYDKYDKEEADEIITSSLMALAITYMYDLLDNMGYDMESLELSPEKCKFMSEYEFDDRTDWRF